jgi:hypothetical protein
MMPCNINKDYILIQISKIKYQNDILKFKEKLKQRLYNFSLALKGKR